VVSLTTHHIKGLFVMSKIYVAGLVLAAATLCATGATAAPNNLHAYCSTHRNTASSGENDTDNKEINAVGANAWRCMDGKVMVCSLGASGAACSKTDLYDARRKKAFADYCHQFPNQDFIDEATSRGLASTWRCVGSKPRMVKKTPVDHKGYYLSAWKPLP
jgi:hypothetical protein